MYSMGVIAPKDSSNSVSRVDASGEGIICGICLEGEVAGRMVRVCQNNHEMHAACLRLFLQKVESRYREVCPLCRNILMVPKAEVIQIRREKCRENFMIFLKMLGGSVLGVTITATLIKNKALLIPPDANPAFLVVCAGFFAMLMAIVFYRFMEFMLR